MTPVGPNEPQPALTSRHLLAVILPLLAIGMGGGLWLWSRHGMGAFLDAATAFLASCL